jgi:hypothetical protein
MNLVFITDPHLGNHRKFGGVIRNGLNDRAQAVSRALKDACDMSVGADALIVCGDLFDTDKPSPALVSAASRAFEHSKTQAHVLVGNHERTSYGSNHTEPMARWWHGEHALLSSDVHAIAVIDGICNDMVLAVPALQKSDQSFVSRISDHLQNQEDIAGRAALEVLCVHAGVMDDSTPAFLRSTSAMELNELFELMEEHDIKLTVCGDWHEFKEYERNGRHVVQLGALVPTGFDNLGIEPYGRVLGYQTDTRKITYGHIAGPRFLKAVYEENELDAAWVAHVMRGQKAQYDLYVKVTVLPENVRHARSDLDSMIKDGAIKGYEIAINKEVARIQAKAAATRARSASSFEDALEAYLRVSPLPQGATRAGVTAKISALLSYKEE